MGQNLVSGDLTGTISDPSGAVIPNATVTLKSVETGSMQATTTNQTGFYRFSLLKPGSYTLTVNAANFEQTTRNVAVLVGTVANGSLTLGLKGATETVEVSQEAPLLQTDNANIATTYNRQQIESLPNPGGDISRYAQTAPGVNMNVGGFGFGNFTAYGLPATSNLFTINGADYNDPFLNLNNSGSSNLTLGSNEIDEVAVISNAYTVQYGRQAGVQESVATRFGTNAFHGNAEYFWNGRALNANEWFNKSGQIQAGEKNQAPFANANQYAASLGGPIVKDKTFFFFDTEGLRYVLPSSGRVFLPTASFSQAVLNNIATNQPAQLPFYQQMFSIYNNAPGASAAQLSTANNGGCGDLAPSLGFGSANPCAETFTSSGKNLNHEWLLAARIDQNLTANNKLYGRFKMDRGEQPTSTDLFNNALFGTHSTQPEYEGQLNDTQIFGSNVVNQAIVSGYWYSAQFLPNGSPAALAAALPYSTVSFANIPFSALGGTSPNAPDSNFPQGRSVTQYEGSDDLSITRGNHAFKIGASFRRNDLSDSDAQTLTRGNLNIGSMTDFFNGVANGIVNNAPADFLTQRFTANVDVPIAVYSLGVYFQDEWRASSNLKLTLGLRADHNSNPVCQSNCFARLVSPFTNLPHDPNQPYNAILEPGLKTAFPGIEKVVLQPRVGVAWNPFGHQSTVIRGGMGIFSDLYQAILADNLFENTPVSNTFIVGGAPLVNAPFAPGVAGNIGGLAANSNASFLSAFASGANLGQILASNPFFSPPNVFSTPDRLLNAKYLEWNLEIQQELGQKTVLSVNYVGTHGYDALIQNAGLNATSAAPGFTAAPQPITVAGQALAGVDPRFGTVTQLTNNGRSNYDGLTTTLMRRAGYGFQGNLTYTWSHSLDDLTSTNPGTPYGFFNSAVFQLDPTNLDRLNYASSDSDVRHLFSANYVWDLPYHFGNRLLNGALGGWQVSGTFFHRSALPYTVTDAGIPVVDAGIAPGVNAPPAVFLGGPVGPCSSPGFTATPNQCVSASQFLASGTETNFGSTKRNFFRGPGYFDTDMSVLKNFAITERARFSVGANFYNLINHPNFGLPFGELTNQQLFGQLFLTAVQPTGPYGSYQGAGVSGRLVQLVGKITF